MRPGFQPKWWLDQYLAKFPSVTNTVHLRRSYPNWGRIYDSKSLGRMASNLEAFLKYLTWAKRAANFVGAPERVCETDNHYSRELSSLISNYITTHEIKWSTWSSLLPLGARYLNTSLIKRIVLTSLSASTVPPRQPWMLSCSVFASSVWIHHLCPNSRMADVSICTPRLLRISEKYWIQRDFMDSWSRRQTPSREHLRLHSGLTLPVTADGLIGWWRILAEITLTDARPFQTHYCKIIHAKKAYR